MIVVKKGLAEVRVIDQVKAYRGILLPQRNCKFSVAVLPAGRTKGANQKSQVRFEVSGFGIINTVTNYFSPPEKRKGQGLDEMCPQMGTVPFVVLRTKS